MALDVENYRPVGTRRHPIGIKTIESPAVTSATQAIATFNKVDGVVCQVAFDAGTLPSPDTTYNVEIRDAQGNVVWSRTNIPHASAKYYQLQDSAASAEDLRFVVSIIDGNWDVRWSWTTAGTLGAGFFKVKLFFLT